MTPSLPWPRRILLMLAASLAVCLVYGGINHFAAWRAARGETFPVAAFAFERDIPYLPWTLPFYLSALPLFQGAFLACRTREEWRGHAWRTALALGVAAAVFLAFPLNPVWAPAPEPGWQTFMRAMDPPHNLCPSLHVAFAVTSLALYARRLPRAGTAALAGWYLLVCASTTTTHQHHLADIAAGLALGLLAVFLVKIQPDTRTAPISGSEARA